MILSLPCWPAWLLPGLLDGTLAGLPDGTMPCLLEGPLLGLMEAVLPGLLNAFWPGLRRGLIRSFLSFLFPCLLILFFSILTVFT